MGLEGWDCFLKGSGGDRVRFGWVKVGRLNGRVVGDRKACIVLERWVWVGGGMCDGALLAVLPTEW